MFRGRFEHSLDEKGRLAIPARFREFLNSRSRPAEAVIVTNFDRCLVAYPLPEWETLEDRFSKLPQFDPNVSAFQRYFLSGASECPIDKGGRILLPPTLREFAKIERDCIVAGQLGKFEIWAKEIWDNEFQELSGKFASMTTALSNLGIIL